MSKEGRIISAHWCSGSCPNKVWGSRKAVRSESQLYHQSPFKPLNTSENRTYWCCPRGSSVSISSAEEQRRAWTFKPKEIVKLFYFFIRLAGMVSSHQVMSLNFSLHWWSGSVLSARLLYIHRRYYKIIFHAVVDLKLLVLIERDAHVDLTAILYLLWEMNRSSGLGDVNQATLDWASSSKHIHQARFIEERASALRLELCSEVSLKS